MHDRPVGGRLRKAAATTGAVAKRRDLSALRTSVAARRKAMWTTHATAIRACLAVHEERQPMGGRRTAGRHTTHGRALGPRQDPVARPPNKNVSADYEPKGHQPHSGGKGKLLQHLQRRAVIALAPANRQPRKVPGPMVVSGLHPERDLPGKSAQWYTSSSFCKYSQSGPRACPAGVVPPIACP